MLFCGGPVDITHVLIRSVPIASPGSAGHEKKGFRDEFPIHTTKGGWDHLPGILRGLEKNPPWSDRESQTSGRGSSFQHFLDGNSPVQNGVVPRCEPAPVFSEVDPENFVLRY